MLGLQCCVRRRRLSSSVPVALCIVAKRCVLEQKLLLRAYRKSYMRNRLVPKWNDLDLCLEVVSRSRQPLCYIWRWISPKPLDIEVWRTTNRKWHMGYRMVTWPMTSRYLERSNSWPQYAQSAISRKLLELVTSNLVCGFELGMLKTRTNNYPESGRGLGHVALTISIDFVGVRWPGSPTSVDI